MKKLITKLTGREKFLAITLIAVLSFGILAAWAPSMLNAWRGFSKANANNYQQLVVGPADTYTRGVFFFNRGTLTNGIEIENDGTVTTALDIDNDGVMGTGLNIDNVSIANLAAPGNVIGAVVKASATTAAQANTTLFGAVAQVDIDQDVAEATALAVSINRDGTADSAGEVMGAKIEIDYEAGAAMTSDVWGLYVGLEGTNATTGTSRVACFYAQVGTTEVVEIENEAGKTTGQMLMIDADGTATNGIFIDNAGTMTTGIKLDGTITRDMVFQNEEYLDNATDGTLGTDADFVVDGGQIGLTADPDLISMASTALTINGTCDFTGDIDAVNSGQIAGTFYVDDAAQNATDTVMDTAGSATYNQTDEIVMVRAGSVVGIGCFGNANVTTNDFTFDVTIDGTNTGLIATLDTTSLNTHVNTQAKDTDTFTAGQRIGIKWSSQAGALPTGTTDYTCTVLVEH